MTRVFFESLEQLKKDYDERPEKDDSFFPRDKTQMRKDVEEQILFLHKLWKHMNNKDLPEFFAMIARANGYLTAYVPSVAMQEEAIVMINKDLQVLDVVTRCDDDEELEQTFQWFEEFSCSKCGGEAIFDSNGVIVCNECGSKIDPFSNWTEDGEWKGKE